MRTTEKELALAIDLTSLSYYTLTKVADASGYANPIAALPAIHKKTGRTGIVTLDKTGNFVAFRWREPLPCLEVEG